MAETPPADGEPFVEMLRDVERFVLPNLMHWQHPGFFGYFPANASWPAVLGDLLSSALGVQGMLWQTSPACTEVEVRVLDWLALALGLPGSFTSSGRHAAMDNALRAAIGASPTSVGEGAAADGGTGGGGVILGTASEATLTALAAALDRHRRAGGGAQPVAYCSEQAHSSFVKAAGIAGLGREWMRLVPVGGDGAMDAGALAAMVREDLAAGRSPVFVGATLGTTGVGAFDPVDAIADAIGAERGVGGPAPWLHVDAAWAGAAFVCPEHRGPLRGAERADSFSFNPHKWLLTNFDCSAFWVNGEKAKSALLEAMRITPEYLRNAASASGEVTDFRDWHIPLGRRFRALKLWFVMRHYGVRGLQAFVRGHIRDAEALERVAAESVAFEVVSRSLSLVCLAHRAGDEATRAVLERVNESGRVFVTHTAAPAHGSGGGERYVIRVAIGGTATGPEHVRLVWRELCAAADSLPGAGALS
jgi:aromatic-L-amino-acid decarboxylase